MGQVHKKYIVASTLMLVVVGINLVAAFLSEIDFNNNQFSVSKFAELAISISFIYLGLAYLIRRGYKWIKYGLLLLLTASLFFAQLPSSILGWTSLAMQVFIVIILFTIPKSQS